MLFAMNIPPIEKRDHASQALSRSLTNPLRTLSGSMITRFRRLSFVLLHARAKVSERRPRRATRAARDGDWEKKQSLVGPVGFAIQPFARDGWVGVRSWEWAMRRSSTLTCTDLHRNARTGVKLNLI